MTTKTAISTAVLLVLSTAAHAERVAPDDMAAYCRGEASAVYGVKPTYIQTENLKQTKKGAYVVKGTADLGNQGTKHFKCRFDMNGEFRDVMSLTDEGAM
jgi:hypothetical protein